MSASNEASGSILNNRHGSHRVVWCLLFAVCILLCSGIFLRVESARNAALRTQSKGYLKQIGLASHNFNDAWNHFPPLAADGSDDPKVNVPTSLHTSILPWIEQATLWERIDKSVAWDAQVNREPFSIRVVAYSSKYFGNLFVEDGYALTHFVPNKRIIENGRGLRTDQVPDGSSNTIFIGSVNEAAPKWGQPNNGRDPANGFAGGPDALGGPEGGALIGLFDGSVRFISAETTKKVALSLATPAGDDWSGEPVPKQ